MVGRTDKFVAHLRTLAHPVRQDNQIAAEPYQSTGAEKKDEENLDTKITLIERHADEKSDAKQARILLLQAAEFRNKLRNAESKHAAQMEEVLERQKELRKQKEELERRVEELERKHEAERREAHNEYSELLAKQQRIHHAIVKRLGVTLQHALGGVAERRGKWFGPAKQDVTSEMDGLVFTIGTMADLLNRMMASLVEVSQELELGEDYPGEEFMLARVLASMKSRIFTSEKWNAIDRRAPDILEAALPSSESIELKLDSLLDRVNNAVRDQKKAAVAALGRELDEYIQTADTTLGFGVFVNPNIKSQVRGFCEYVVNHIIQECTLHQQLATMILASAKRNNMYISPQASRLRVDSNLSFYINNVDVRLDKADTQQATLTGYMQLDDRMMRNLATSGYDLDIAFDRSVKTESGADSVEDMLATYIAKVTSKLSASRKTITLTSKCLREAATNQGLVLDGPKRSNKKLAAEYVASVEQHLEHVRHDRISRDEELRSLLKSALEALSETFYPDSDTKKILSTYIDAVAAKIADGSQEKNVL